MRYGRSVWVGAVGALLALAASCGPEPLGQEPSPDAGGLTTEVAPDGGAPADAGTEPDAGTVVDAGTVLDAGTPADAGTAPDAGTGPSVRVRIMASNLTSGNYQSYDPGEGARILEGLHPDVVLMQEFNVGDNSEAAVRGWVDSTFGTDFQYARETGAQIPNGIISRWPILASGEWDDTQVDNRDFAWARIDVPGPKDLWAISVHLLTSSSTTRNTEATALVGFIKANVPAGDLLVIGGDFNTSSNSEACLTTLAQQVTTSGPGPVDQANNPNTNSTRSKPYDHVFVDGDLGAYQVPVVVGATSFPAGLVVDTRVYSPLSDLAPARSTDSGATNMQHMGVVKDFLLPTP